LERLPLDLIEKCLAPLFPLGRHPLRAQRVRNLSRLLQAEAIDLMQRLETHSAAGDLHGRPLPSLPAADTIALLGGGYLRKAMQMDLAHYLPDDVLAKVDRATMRVSLESRAPLLDHRIYEFACRLPSAMLVEKGRQKRILRDVLIRHVPSHLVDRPKAGFSVPLNQWLSKDLRHWARDLVSSQGALRTGMDPVSLTRLLEEHEKGGRDNSAMLWPALSLVAWAERALPVAP
jgi:asparagine synthase (glutamine-hydrolysing)